MTVLTSAVSIGDNQLRIDTPLAAGQVPGFVKIDSELLSVGGQDNLAGTVLVLSEPAREAHDSGATVTYAGRPYDPTFKTALTGNGAQAIRLLGPFRVNYNHNWETVLATLGAGTVVLSVSVFVITPWNPGGPLAPLLTIAVAPVGNPGGYVQVGQITEGLLGPSGTSAVLRASIVDPSDYRAVWVPSGGILIADLPTAGQTVGALDIYALIAEPA